MKELSIEEKAKAYDEALEKARKLCAYPTTKPFISDLQDLFPELKESKDEKIRKEMILYFQEEIPQCSIQEHADKMKEFIAWLEKQNSLMKCLQIANARIGELIEENYYLKEKQSEQKPFEWSEEDKKMLGYAIKAVHYMYVGKHHSLITDIYVKTANWLKSLKDRVILPPEQEWGDEDEKYFNILISLVNNPSAEGMFDYHKTNKSAFNNWLKSLKERCCPQKHWKPTEEQIGALEHIIDSTVSSHTFMLKELVKQLKAL